MKIFTCKKRFEHYMPDTWASVIRVDPSDNFVLIRDTDGREYIAGDAAKRLYDYEELGRSPEEIKKILDNYDATKHILANHTHGTLPKLSDFNTKNLIELIDDAMKKKDRSVTIFTTAESVQVSVYPYEEDEE